VVSKHLEVFKTFVLPAAEYSSSVASARVPGWAARKLALMAPAETPARLGKPRMPRRGEGGPPAAFPS
jgi:hypothetical protein